MERFLGGFQFETIINNTIMYALYLCSGTHLYQGLILNYEIVGYVYIQCSGLIFQLTKLLSHCISSPIIYENDPGQLFLCFLSLFDHIERKSSEKNLYFLKEKNFCVTMYKNSYLKYSMDIKEKI